MSSRTPDSRVLIIGPHPDDGRSMHRYSFLLEQVLSSMDGIEARLIQPRRILAGLASGKTSKYLKYIDKFLIFFFRCLFTSARFDLVLVADHSDAIYAAIRCAPRNRTIVICHDLIAASAAAGEVLGVEIGRFGRLYQRLVLRGLKQVRVVAISRFTQSELERTAGIPSVVVHNPVPPSFADETVYPRFGERVRRLVIVAPDHWRKNRVWGVQLFVALRCHLPDLKMTLVGSELNEQERRALGSMVVDVEHASGISDADLRDLYLNSLAVVQPSKFEGFGWPVVEANACGTPAICFDTPVNREVGGASAAYLSRISTETVREVSKQLSSPSHYADWSRSAQLNAERFSIERFSLGLEHVLRAARHYSRRSHRRGRD